MFLGLLIAIDVLMIISFAFTPYVTRKTELFGVSVPSDQIDIPELTQLRGRYRNVMLGLGAVILAATCMFGASADFTTPGSVWVMLAIMLGYVLAAFLTYLPCHFTMKRIKAGKDWSNAPLPAVVTVSTSPATADMISPAWLLLFPLTILLGLVVTWLAWPQLPDPLPVHFDANGVPDAYSPKGFQAISHLLLVEVFLAVILIGVFFMMRHARRQTDAAKPVESLEQDKRFRRFNSIFIVALGVALLVLLQTMILVSMMGIPTSWTVFGPVIALLVVAAAGSWYLMFRVGQGGSRLRIRSADSAAAVNYDDDRFWKLGTFYFNPDDPAVFVEKRFGVGWTNNFARPLTWVIIAGFLALLGAVLAITYLLL